MIFGLTFYSIGYEKENKAVIVVENKCSSFNKDKIEFIFDKFMFIID